MAIGTPDNVQAVDSNLIGYKDQAITTSFQVASGNRYYPINITSGQGCFGYAVYTGDKDQAWIEIWIDGIKIFTQSPYLCRYFSGLYSPNQSGRYGCCRYDDQTSEYSLFCDHQFQLVFYKTLAVCIWNGDPALLTIGNFRANWKVKP